MEEEWVKIFEAPGEPQKEVIQLPLEEKKAMFYKQNNH